MTATLTWLYCHFHDHDVMKAYFPDQLDSKREINYFIQQPFPRLA